MSEPLMQTIRDLWRILSQGGWVMAAIFIAGQVGWFLVVERWWHFRTMDGSPEAFWKKAPADSSALAAALAPGKRPKGLFGSVAGSVVEARQGGQKAMVENARIALQRDVPPLSRHLNTIAILATSAPLLGLAGTVAGIMETFDVITLYGAGNPSMMAGGIAQALMVTEAGLVVAFPLLICHDLLRKRADRIEDATVAATTRLIRMYSAPGTKGARGAQGVTV
ncbi:MAG: MotA/TolQ/ExbB proton channel family protein [Fibrobacterota bacterium]|nr:MotA/TolQ/ExbB proton channel family protein [Fibrobacterota bacterium]